MSEKNYIKWSAKAVPTQFWEIINLSLNLDELNKLPNNNGYIRLSVMKKRETDQWGNTHYVVENTYQRDDSNTWSAQQQPAKSNDVDEELPF